MTSSVRTACAEDELPGIWQLLVDEKCHHVPIVEKKRPIGIISTRDLMRLSQENGGEKVSSGIYEKKTAAEIMSTDLETVQVDDPVEVAIDRIGCGDIHALIVLDDDENLAGIVTNHDLLNYLLS
jgi:CBS domain-containing protein